jgi:hypothetical protein
MTPDPNPGYLIAIEVTNGPIMRPDPYRVERSMQPLEANGWVLRIRQPNPVTAFRKLLDLTRQRMVTSPKASRGFGNHETGGQSLSVLSLRA